MPQQIQVDKYVFSVRDRYSEGDEIGPVETELLNRLFAESVRVQASPALLAYIKKIPGRLLTEVEISAAQTNVEVIGNTFELKVPPLAPKYGTIDHKARTLALEEATRDALSEGHALTDEEASAEVERRIKNPQLRQRARASFEAEARAAQMGLDSL